MANRRIQPVRYRKFKPKGRLPEGLLAVARQNGDMERRVAAGFYRLAAQMGRFADRQAAVEGEQAGIRDALSGSPQAGTVTAGSVPRGIVVSSREGNETAARARDYLVEKHRFQPHWAAAAAGHGMQESGFNLAAVGDNGTAFGAFQWRGNRYTNGKRFAARSGRAWKTLETQLDFFVHELKTSESYAGQALFASTNLEEAVTALMHFERPAGYTRTNPRAGHGYSNRLAFAQGVSGIAADDSARYESPSVTPLPEPVPVRSAAPGTFRPTGSATIRGRAYNVAGTRTYLQQLDLMIHQDMAAVYDAYAEDPVMLNKALGELKTAHLRESVFAEIAGDYNHEFETRRRRMVERSRDAFEVRQKQAEHADLLGRIDDLEEEKARFLAGQSAGAQRDADDLFVIQRSIDAQYDDAVQRGILTSAQAERHKRDSMRSTSVAFHLGQADGKTAEEIGDMRQQLGKDYAAGELPNVDRESYADIDAGLAKLERDRRSAEQKAGKDLRRDGDQLALRILAGETIPEADVNAFHRAIQAAPDAEGVAASALRRMRVAQALKTLPLAAVRHNLKDLVTREDGTVDLDDLAFARDLVARQEKALTTDPLSVAERYGTIPAVSDLLDAAQAGGMVPAVAERIDAAHVVADHFDTRPKYFKADEPAQIAELIRRDPNAGLSLVAGIVEAGGPVSGDMLRELREAAPEAEWAGVVLALDGNPRAAQDAILGNLPGADGKRAENPVKKNRQVLNRSTMGGAFSQLHPEDRGRVEESAMSIARHRAQTAGVAKDSPEAEQIYQEALNAAAGAVQSPSGQRGGFGEVNGHQTLLPPGLTEDDVEDALEALSDDDLARLGAPLSPLAEAGVTISADDVRDGILFAVAPGVYRVAVPKGGRLEFFGAADGGFWELDLRRWYGWYAARTGIPGFGYTTGGDF